METPLAPCLITIKGQVGQGKTLLMLNLIDDLRQSNSFKISLDSLVKKQLLFWVLTPSESSVSAFLYLDTSGLHAEDGTSTMTIIK